jgi:hypothetical protein
MAIASRKRRLYISGSILIVALAAVIRIRGAQNDLWLDEIWSLHLASLISGLSASSRRSITTALWLFLWTSTGHRSLGNVFTDFHTRASPKAFASRHAGWRDDQLEFMKHIVDVAKAQILQMLDASMSDRQKCPLCGRPNRCAMAEGHPVGACWCVSMRLTADMLEAVPTEDRGVRCICDTCARALASGGA